MQANETDRTQAVQVGLRESSGPGSFSHPWHYVPLVLQQFVLDQGKLPVEHGPVNCWGIASFPHKLLTSEAAGKVRFLPVRPDKT